MKWPVSDPSVESLLIGSVASAGWLRFGLAPSAAFFLAFFSTLFGSLAVSRADFRFL